MKTYSYEEFVRVDEKFQEDKLDFYGEFSPLTTIEQKEFLQKYAEYHKARFGANATYLKAVEPEEVDSCKQSLNLPFDKGLQWDAYKRKKTSVYEGWQLYTDRAIVEDDTLVLKDSYAWPVPCAKFEFDNEQINVLHFFVKISKRYKAPVFGGVLSTTTGRYVELRSGLKEIIKLYFSPNGYFTYKDSTFDNYRYKNNVLGNYKFDEWNEIKINRIANGFSIQFNDVYQEFERDLCGIDTLFIGGGMQPADEWAFKPVYFESDKRTLTNLFNRSVKQDIQDIFLGKVSLPFVIGTEKNKDYQIVLKRKIFCKQNKTYKLDVDALDPGGEIWINGNCITKKDGFQPFSMDITKYLVVGENQLQVVVYPRAPESLFNWHKHNDYYNGWFCQGVNVVESEIYSEAFVEVETRRVGEKSTFDVIVKNIEFATQATNYKIYLQKIYPIVCEKIILSQNVLTGATLKQSFTESVDVWNTENPVLYEISVEFYRGEQKIYQTTTQTGFRTISQGNGQLFLNGQKIVLKGALTMQFLPPYDEVPINHICPTEEQIVWQALMIKSMNGNCLRLHQLGYGTNDKRFAAICDRLGVLLIWTTRLIDSAENMQWTQDWKQAEQYKEQILKVKNHPSIIIWEGSNEGHFYPKLIDKVYDNFVKAVKEVDTTRLLCPVSHLYYSWGDEGEKCGYYTNDGKKDENGNEVRSSFGWMDELVVRSAHPYGILLGYGQPWQNMVTQCYKFQDDLMPAKDKAYLVSEFAIIGRQNPNTPEAKEFINKQSYEFNDELNALGFIFDDAEWELSQAFQALCTATATKKLRCLGADGMLWCCLTGGANNASYLKPIIDFYGYKKLAYYQLKEAFVPTTAFNEKTDVLWNAGYKVRPIITGIKNNMKYSLDIEIFNEKQQKVASKKFCSRQTKNNVLYFEEWIPKMNSGYYTIRYIVNEKVIHL